MELPRLIEDLRRKGESWSEIFRVPAMSLGIYTLRAGEKDTQTPHLEDEIYYVLGGRATIRVGEEKRKVGPGAVVFVAAKAKHRFEDVAEDLTLLVVFAPAEDAAGAAALA
jgi:mannose-6-phosphate isomerase-like protein (cupin superfamily)